MTYFRNKQPDQPHQRVFNAPLPEDNPYEDDDEYDDAYAEPMTQEEYDAYTLQEEKEHRYRLFSGITHLIGVVLGTLMILVLIALLISLVSWVINDMRQSFTILQSWF